MRLIFLRLAVVAATLAAAAGPAAAGFALRIEPASPTVAANGTAELSVYLREDAGGTVLTDEGLIAVGLTVTLTDGSILGVSPSLAFAADPMTLPFFDLTVSGSSATFSVLADPGATAFATGNEIFLGAFTVGGWTGPGDVTATVAALQDPTITYTVTGRLDPDPRVLDGDIRAGAASFEVLGDPGAQPTPAPGGLVLLASGLFPLIGYVRWRRASQLRSDDSHRPR